MPAIRTALRGIWRAQHALVNALAAWFAALAIITAAGTIVALGDAAWRIQMLRGAYAVLDVVP